MAQGKNKRISKGKGKGSKKKQVDPFSKKDWYDIKAPKIFSRTGVGKTLCTRTQGQRIASEELKGRVVEVNLADLQNDEQKAFRKIKLKIEDVQGRNCLTNFYGMDMTTDKVRFLVRKFQSLIEASVDVKTTDGYLLRLFAIGFTAKQDKQVKKTCYAKASQKRRIRKTMGDIMLKESQVCDLKDLVDRFKAGTIGTKIMKQCKHIYPLKDTYVRKVKLLKAPKFDQTKLMEVHEAYTEEVGTKVQRPDEGDAVAMDTAT